MVKISKYSAILDNFHHYFHIFIKRIRHDFCYLSLNIEQ